MTIRNATLAAALALALAATGCGEKCNDEIPITTDMQESCTAVAGQPVTVQLRACPRCDQGTPRCEVRMEHVGSQQDPGYIQLEPLSEVCEPTSGCPLVDPATCPFEPVSCTFVAPAAASAPYDIVLFGPNGETLFDTTLTVVASGASSGCGSF